MGRQPPSRGSRALGDLTPRGPSCWLRCLCCASSGPARVPISESIPRLPGPGYESAKFGRPVEVQIAFDLTQGQVEALPVQLCGLNGGAGRGRCGSPRPHGRPKSGSRHRAAAYSARTWPAKFASRGSNRMAHLLWKRLCFQAGAKVERWCVAVQEWLFYVLNRQQSVLQECPTRVFYKGVLQECPTRVSYKSVPQECPARVSRKSVPQECPTSVSQQCVRQECPTRVSHRVFYKSVPQECPTRVYDKSILQECLKSVSDKSVPQELVFH